MLNSISPDFAALTHCTHAAFKVALLQEQDQADAATFKVVLCPQEQDQARRSNVQGCLPPARAGPGAAAFKDRPLLQEQEQEQAQQSA